jgi:hypothetical protein
MTYDRLKQSITQQRQRIQFFVWLNKHMKNALVTIFVFVFNSLHIDFVVVLVVVLI